LDYHAEYVGDIPSSHFPAGFEVVVGATGPQPSSILRIPAICRMLGSSNAAVVMMRNLSGSSAFAGPMDGLVVRASCFNATFLPSSRNRSRRFVAGLTTPTNVSVVKQLVICLEKGVGSWRVE